MSTNRKERGIIVKKFTMNKYGFIHQVMLQHDIFFHMKDFKDGHFDDCHIGDKVEFDLVCNNEKFFARNIKLCPKKLI